MFSTPTLPTLPSIDMLGLPRPSMHRDSSPGSPSDSPFHDSFSSSRRYHSRRSSMLSSSSSRTPSPDPSEVCAPSSRSALPPAQNSAATTPAKVRLVPCELGLAEAVVYVPPPQTLCVANISLTARANESRALLLTGEALKQVRRHPQRAIAKGARIHPYRVLRTAEMSRRASVSSESSSAGC